MVCSYTLELVLVLKQDIPGLFQGTNIIVQDNFSQVNSWIWNVFMAN